MKAQQTFKLLPQTYAIAATHARSPYNIFYNIHTIFSSILSTSVVIYLLIFIFDYENLHETIYCHPDAWTNGDIFFAFLNLRSLATNNGNTMVIKNLMLLQMVILSQYTISVVS